MSAGNSEMLVFLSVFFQQRAFFKFFNGRLGKKQKNVGFYGVCMYVRPKLTFVSFFFCFLFCTFPVYGYVFIVGILVYGGRSGDYAVTGKVGRVGGSSGGERWNPMTRAGKDSRPYLYLYLVCICICDCICICICICVCRSQLRDNNVLTKAF